MRACPLGGTGKKQENPSIVYGRARDYNVWELKQVLVGLIAETLLEGLDFEENFEVSEAWRKEIRRRCQDIDSGNVTLIDSNRVVGDLRKKYS